LILGSIGKFFHPSPPSHLHPCVRFPHRSGPGNLLVMAALSAIDRGPSCPWRSFSQGHKKNSPGRGTGAEEKEMKRLLESRLICYVGGGSEMVTFVAAQKTKPDYL